MWAVARRLAATTVPCTVPYGPTPGVPFDELRMGSATHEVAVLGWAPAAWTTVPSGVGVVVVVAGTIAVERLDGPPAGRQLLGPGDGFAHALGTSHRVENVGDGPATTVHVTLRPPACPPRGRRGA
jgi:hypothetical protein